MALFGTNEDQNNERVEPKTGTVLYGDEPRRNSTVKGYSYQKAPPVGQWLKSSLIDIATLICFGALALGVSFATSITLLRINKLPAVLAYANTYKLYYVKPTARREFPINFQDGEVVQPEFAYPIHRYILPIWAVALISILGPILVVLLMQIRVKSFWDCNNAIFGILYSVVTAACIQVFLKWLIGGIAPNFLEVCNPVLPPQPNGDNIGKGFRQIYYNSMICQGDPLAISRAMESFPDGKSTAAFAGLVFLSLYLNAKLKVMSNYHPEMWKLVLTLVPLVGAMLIAGTNTVDRGHHWYDCVAGALLGTLTAFISYRMVYSAIWDFRFNHIPTNRNVPSQYGAPQTENTKACFTSRAGWGEGTGTFGGAPYDTKSTQQPGVVSMSRIDSVYADGATAHGHGPVIRDGAHNSGPSQTTGVARDAPPTVTVDEITPVTSNGRL